jgi:hypothetical protein
MEAKEAQRPSSVPKLAWCLAMTALLAALALAPRAGAYVYWASGGGDTIGRANNDGSGRDDDFIPVGSATCGVAVNSAHVYWGNPAGGSIGRATLAAGAVDQSLVSGLPLPCAPTLDGTHVYWANLASGAMDPLQGSIGRANLDGGAPQPVVFGNQSTFVEDPCGTANRDGFLYWVNGGSDPRRIGRSPIPDPLPVGGFVPEAGGDAATACWPAVSSTHIYWSVFPFGIARTPLNDTTALELFANASATGGTSIHGERLYWGNGLEGTISRAGLDGDDEEIAFLTGVDGPFGIAVDSGAPTVGFGRLNRNRKKGTGKLILDIPMAGTLSLTAPGLKAASVTTDGPAQRAVTLKPKGKARKKLARKGKRVFSLDVEFAPEESAPNSSSRDLKLIKKR